ncbi:MAG: 4-alpha-glucanotransferase, partial [Oscillospiraceae bacterium]|nr:4-alpha-glucanotransferase [Oscillospiraceae bacterium]
MKKEKRTAGILMPLASLPNNEGVGGMGDEAYKFIDLAVEMGFSIWQLLPLNPLGFGNSPYQPYSSYAGDEIYVSLAMLERDGYLPEGFEPYVCTGDADRIDYPSARKYKDKYLRIAAKNFYAKNKEKKAFDAFASQEWVYNFAVFLALKGQNGMRSWNEWPVDQRD